ncbi:MAG: hypothetical protein AMXMBFR64_53540 [Myxococcales bacterium]
MRHRTWFAVVAVLAVAACGVEGQRVEETHTAGDSGVGTTRGPEGGSTDVAEASELPGDSTAVKHPADWVTDMDRDPRNVHMTWQGDPGSTITVSWATTDVSLEGYTPRLWIAPASLVEGAGEDRVMPFADAWVFEGKGEVYNESLGGMALGGDYVAWHVEAVGLTPDTDYVYRVGTWEAFDEETGHFTRPNLSPTHTLRTGPAKGARGPIRFVLAGDSRGGQEVISQHAERLAAIDAVLWFFNGDFTAAGLQAEFDTWWTAMSAITIRRVLMAVQGNHEFFADIYYAQLALPDRGDLPDEYREHAWSFDLGNIHFVGLDSNTEEAAAAQVPWLDADLAAARKDPDIDWIITMMHHPAYSACTNHGSTKRVQDLWVPVFEKHSVDVAFSGHDHNYERTVPIKANQEVSTAEGVTYIVAGGFFSPPYSNGKDWWTAASAHGEKANYVVVEVEGKTLRAKAWSGDGNELLDELEIVKP